MDAGLTACDVCNLLKLLINLLKLLIPFGNNQHQVGVAFGMARIFDGPAMQMKWELEYTLANAGW